MRSGKRNRNKVAFLTADQIETLAATAERQAEQLSTRRKRRQSGHNVEARPDCTLGGILVGPRITEISGHAIADEKADLRFMALNQLCAYCLKVRAADFA